MSILQTKSKTDLPSLNSKVSPQKTLDKKTFFKAAVYGGHMDLPDLP